MTDLIIGIIVFFSGFWLGIWLYSRLRKANDKQVKDLIDLVEDPRDMIMDFEKNLQEKSGMFEEARRTAQATESKPESQEPSKPSSENRN